MADSGWARRVYAFVKWPSMGRVKTRLAADIGPVAATAFYRRTSGSVLTGLADDPRWRLVLATDPRDRLHQPVPGWPRRAPRLAQTGGDLGRRMGDVFFRAPPGPVVIIGADAPDLRPRHIAEAFRALGAADAVFGPAHDGGYWLIGLKRLRAAPRLFENVRWSTAHALKDTIESLPADFSVRRLEVLRDVDRGADLAALRR
ncbi:MAG: TIGR04282 family arsenosugar biosynthesis glycosyltransferase [Pseudomonadota bacterium]